MCNIFLAIQADFGHWGSCCYKNKVLCLRYGSVHLSVGRLDSFWEVWVWITHGTFCGSAVPTRHCVTMIRASYIPDICTTSAKYTQHQTLETVGACLYIEIVLYWCRWPCNTRYFSLYWRISDWFSHRFKGQCLDREKEWAINFMGCSNVNVYGLRDLRGGRHDALWQISWSTGCSFNNGSCVFLTLKIMRVMLFTRLAASKS